MISTFLRKQFEDKTEVAVFVAAFLVEIIFGLYLVYRWGFAFVSRDAVTHTYIPKTIVNNNHGSLSFEVANLGTVWLPMFHILTMPLVLIDPLYRTGLAGTIVNGVATAGTCLIFYRLLGGGKIGFLAILLYVGNVFTLIYGATPMMEQTAMFFTVLASYYFKRYWETGRLTEFMKCGVALIFGTLTRYEVWAVAFLAILFFALRELRNGQRYRIAYLHFPLWGVFAWLFWNLAVFRDPLMFIRHPLSAQVQAIGDPNVFYVGSMALTTSTLVKRLFSVSGLLWGMGILSMITFILTRRRFSSTIVGMLMVSPLAFHWGLMFTGTSIGAARFFYIPLLGLVFLAINLARACSRSIFKSILMAAILISFVIGFKAQLEMVAGRGSELEEFASLYESMERMKRVKDLVGNKRVLSEAGTEIETNGAGLSVFGGVDPDLIIDPYDPVYEEASLQPWKYCSFVILSKTSGSLELNSYYKGKYYAYLYYNDSLWRAEFLSRFETALETENFIVFQLKEDRS